jgi:predicted nucleic acid-binding Zn ribbon protein
MTLGETLAMGRWIGESVKAGSMSAADAASREGELRAQTPDGCHWHLRVAGLAWLWWDGGAWADPLLGGYCRLGCTSEMDFGDLEALYEQGRSALSARRSTPAEFGALIDARRVAFYDGSQWRMRPRDGAWFCRTATTWVGEADLAALAASAQQVIPTVPVSIPVRPGGTGGGLAARMSLLCATCSHLGEGQSCRAFPHGIPEPILDGRWDHRKPHPGDSHVRYACSAGGPRSAAGAPHERTCPRCGAPMEPGWVFCGECGAAIPAEPTAAAPQTRFCVNCGSPMEAGWVFCGKCGSPVLRGPSAAGPGPAAPR